MPDHADILQCHRCGLTQRSPRPNTPARVSCCRCRADLSRRKRHRPQVTLALAVAGAVLFLAANLQPILELSKMGYISTETLVGGVIAVWNQGYWPLAILILLASVLFPVMKITLLILLGWGYPLRRTSPRWTLFWWKVSQAIDQWAMVDVYLLAVAVGLIKLSALATVTLGPGLYALVGVVILLAVAPATFDPTSLWDERTTTA